MFNPIEMRRRMVQERIEKSFDNEIEKAHKDGDMHPNGKWVWVSSAAGGKGDWRTINGRAHQKHNAAQGSASGGNTPEDKEYAEKFKKNFKDASDDVLNKVISGKIQGTDRDKRLAKEILDERKSSAEGEKSAKKIIDLLKVSSSKYSDIKKVTAFKTDKGNWAIDYDGANTGIILNGSKLSEKGLKAAGVKIEGANANSKKDSDLINDIKSNEDAFIDACGLSNIKRVVSIRETPTSVFIKYENESGQEQEFPITKNVANSVLKEVKSGKSKKTDPKQDKIAQDAGFKDYEEMRGYQEYVTAKNLLKKHSTKGDARKEMETQVADYEKDHADVIAARGGKKKTESYASMDIKDAKKALVGKVVTLVDYWPDGRGGSQDAIGEIKNVRLYGKNKTPIAEVVYPNGDEQMIRLDEIDDGKMKDSYKTPVTIGDDKKKLDAIKNKIASTK